MVTGWDLAGRDMSSADHGSNGHRLMDAFWGEGVPGTVCFSFPQVWRWDSSGALWVYTDLGNQREKACERSGKEKEDKWAGERRRNSHA